MAEGPCSRSVSSSSRGGLVSLARDRKGLVELAKIAEQAERYQDMADCMKAVVQMGGNYYGKKEAYFL